MDDEQLEELDQRVRPDVATPAAKDLTSELQKQITLLKSIIGGMAAVLILGFSAGIIWASWLTYKQLVDQEKGEIAEIQKEMKNFKRNFGKLSDPSYVVEVATDNAESWRCVEGSVVTGLRHDGQRIWMRCASLGRVVYNPD
jgi:cell division protein FtsL